MENIFCAEALNGIVQVNPLAERPVSQAGIAMRPSGEPSGASADLWFIDTAIGPNASDAAGAATPGTKLAVKVMRHGCAAPHKEALESNEAYKADWYKLRQEYETLRSMDGAQGHAPVAYALGWRIKKTPRGEVRYPALAMDYVEGVDIVELREIMSDAHGEVGATDILDTARAIVTALLCCTVVSREDARYLTTVSHRDLSSHNLRFMLNKDGQRIERVMLIDFGQSAQNDDPDVTAADGSERLSTPFIGAPEIFDQRQSEARQWRNTSHADCYSIGCLLYYLRCGAWPHEAQIREICAQSSGGLNAAELQELFELKNKGAVRLDGAHCTDDDDCTLDELIARCTEPGIGKIGGRFDVIRLAERLGIDENGAALADEKQPDPSHTENGGARVKNPIHKNRLARLAPFLCAVAAVAAIVFAIMFATGAFGSKQDNGQLALYPITALSAGQLRESVELIQARLDAADLGKASTIESMDGICVDFSAGALDVPDELNGGDGNDSSQTGSASDSSDVASIYRDDVAELLSRPLELYLACIDSEGNGLASYEHIYRTEIKDVTVKMGKVEGLEPDACANPDRYAYLELTLTDSANKRLKESCSGWLDQGILAFDIGGYSWNTASTVSLGKGRYAFTANNLAPSQDLCEVLAAALRNESYHTGFQGKLMPQAAWIDTDFTGDNQTKKSDLKDRSTLVWFASHDSLSRGERVDALEALAARLDTLGVPYALGDPSDGKGIVAQIQGLDLGEATANLICANSYIKISCGLCRRTLGAPVVKTVDTSAGTKAIQIGDSGTNGDANVGAVTQAAADAGGAWVYLRVGGNPVMRTWVDAASKQLTFDISCATGKAIDTSNEYLADLVSVVVATTELPFMHLDYCGRMDLALSDAPRSLDAEVDEARDAIKAAFPSATVGTNPYDDTELLVSLDLTVDDAFAQEAIDTVETLYNAMDFDSTPFHEVTFYLADERGREQARTWFLRCDGAGEPDRVTVSGSIREGRFEEQRQRVIDAAEANAFFQEHTDDLSSWLL